MRLVRNITENSKFYYKFLLKKQYSLWQEKCMLQTMVCHLPWEYVILQPQRERFPPLLFLIEFL